MGTLESIRGYVDKHPDATSDDWRVAQSQGWRKDGDRRPVTVTVPDNTEAVTRLTRPGGPAAPEGIREAQDKLIRVLLRVLTALNHDAGEKGVMWYVNRVEGDGSIGMTKTQASEWIDRIRAKIHEFAPDHKDGRCNTGGPCAHLAKAVVEIENTPYVKDTRAAWARWRELAAQLVELGGRGGARFAVDTEHGSINSVAFWRISAGRDGRFWVRQVIGGRGDVRVNFGPDTLVSLAEKIIAAGPRECMLRYGRELGTCCRCGSELTNDESRAAGIGPECRKK